MPIVAVAALKKLRPPEMPDAREIRLEAALVLLVAQTKNKTLQYFCEGCSEIMVMISMVAMDPMCGA